MPSIGDQLLMQRGDLLSFPKETVDLILEMQKDGWRGHRNAQGHVKMLAPDGETYIMATQNPRSPIYVRGKLRAYNKAHKKEEVNSTLHKTTQKWPCARPNCPKTYASEQHLNDHIAVDHEGLLLCPESDCHETFKRPASLGLHRANKHGYVSPTKEKRVKQKKAKAERKILDAVDGLKPGSDGIKFDTELLDRQIAGVDPEVVRTDSMPIKDIVPDYVVNQDGSVIDNTKSLKEVAKGMAGSVSEFDPPLSFEPILATEKTSPKFVLAPGNAPIIRGRDRILNPTQERHYTGGPSMAIASEGDADYLDSDELFEKHVKLADARDEEVLHFIDDRDSWVIDDPEMMTSSVNSIRKILNAVGLEMEIRVWRKK